MAVRDVTIGGSGATSKFILDPCKGGIHTAPFGSSTGDKALRDEYLREAKKVISDPNVLINVVSRRVKQLRRGHRPLVESLEKLNPEDIALREVIEGKISFELSLES
ncbi:MAG TPA: DNA-directed RNA polymerase subunit omega [Opitutaceae bacterium]